MTPATLHAVRSLLPWWVIWLPLAAPLAAAGIAWALASLGVLVASRGLRSLPPDAHWTERARQVFVVRRTLLRITFLPVLATAPLAIGGPVSIAHGLVLPAVVGVALFSVVGVGLRFENRWVRKASVRVRLRSLAAILVTVYGGILAPLLVSALQPALLPRRGLLDWLVTLTIVAAVFTFGGGLLGARALGLVRPAPERLAAALARALPAGARPPRLFEIRILAVNALALPWLGTVLVSESALEQLDDDALVAVVAHELEHLREPLRIRAVRALFALASALVFPFALALLAVAPLAAFAPLLVYLAAVIAWRRVSVRMERRSDAAGHEASPAMAAALEATYRANLLPAVQGRRTTHPDLVERMTAAGAPPTWPAPPPPPSAVPGVALVAFLTFFLAGGLVLARVVAPRTARTERGYTVAVAIEGRAQDLGWLGILRNSRSPPEAIPFFRAASELRPGDPLWPAWEATSLAMIGRCQEASIALTAASSLSAGDRTYTARAQKELSACVPR